MSEFDLSDYKTRFSYHKEVINELVTEPIPDVYLSRLDVYASHQWAINHVKPKCRVSLSTHIKLWHDWESTIWVPKHNTWLNLLPYSARLALLASEESDNDG